MLAKEFLQTMQKASDWNPSVTPLVEKYGQMLLEEQIPSNKELDLMKRVNDYKEKSEHHFRHMMEYMHIIEYLFGFAGPIERIKEEAEKLKLKKLNL